MEANTTRPDATTRRDAYNEEFAVWSADLIAHTREYNEKSAGLYHQSGDPNPWPSDQVVALNIDNAAHTTVWKRDISRVMQELR